ncbi:MAG: hypothetical protein QOC87_1020, partial [Actinomycetota bacterium]|nr:hypothetical protein [Actinomycetota bacterium]
MSDFTVLGVMLMSRVRIVPLLALLLALSFGASQLVSSSAAPAPPTLTAGTTSLALTTSRLSASPPATSLILCDQGNNCAARDLNVAISPRVYAAGDRLMTIRLEWASSKDDLDLYICRTSSVTFSACLD